jgi:hypothetical protein
MFISYFHVTFNENTPSGSLFITTERQLNINSTCPPPCCSMFHQNFLNVDVYFSNVCYSVSFPAQKFIGQPCYIEECKSGSGLYCHGSIKFHQLLQNFIRGQSYGQTDRYETLDVYLFRDER